jgi:hypothetical protein
MWFGMRDDKIPVYGKRVTVPSNLKVKVDPSLSSCAISISGLNRTITLI